MADRSDIINQERLGLEKLNNQGSPMKIIEYIDSSNITVEFQDKYKYRIKTIYANFKSGSIRNPYYPSVYNVGIVGCKYPTKIDGKHTKEYDTWVHILQRCYDEKKKENQPTYKNVVCCEEWLNFESFCDWLHEQKNFNKWKNGKRWAIDKDILVKRNKMYSPETCTLVPQNVNCLFLKREAQRGKYPIGVSYRSDGFLASFHNPFTNNREELGYYSTPEKAFVTYKTHKEDVIKQVAETEYDNGNITEECYIAMMRYEVEIDD